MSHHLKYALILLMTTASLAAQAQSYVSFERQAAYLPVGVVLQKLVIDAGGLRPSYLGPPESYRADQARATSGTLSSSLTR